MVRLALIVRERSRSNLDDRTRRLDSSSSADDHHCGSPYHHSRPADPDSEPRAQADSPQWRYLQVFDPR